MRRLAAALGLALALAGPAGAVDIAAITADKPPETLSAFGFFADMAARKPAAGVMPYAMATPLFTDFAVKFRYAFTPPGQAAAWSDNEAFSFPVGSALIKTFAYPADFAKPAEAIRMIETRVLLNGPDGWKAYAYVWNAAQTDATLKLAGAKIPLTFRDVSGKDVAFTYAVPNKNQCKGCHALNGAVTPIGPKARNLNHVADHGGGAKNQLAAWIEAGALAGAPDPASAPAVPDWRDEAAPLEARARAWLDVNCAHCHRREGPASNSGLFLTWGEQDRTALGFDKRPVAAGRGSGDLAFDIVAGKPDESILFRRIESTEPGVMMPEIGRSLADAEAIALLRRWIESSR
ncbi:MAG: hypothetical protein IPL47_05265 [Phyllobacteriaceae bacterium]|nr:hypothetical protein [Phyllobacteriaceae bacterium]